MTTADDPMGGTGAADQRPFVVTYPCPVCEGQGAVDGRPCAACHGTGVRRFFHGTKADLKPGDLIEAGHDSNFGKRKQANFVYLTGTLDAAVWGAELAVGEGRGRVFTVEPTGPIEDDPNLTDKKFPGNPTKSYRTRQPLRVTGEVEDWEGHPPDALKTMKDNVEEMKRRGVEAIDD